MKSPLIFFVNTHAIFVKLHNLKTVVKENISPLTKTTPKSCLYQAPSHYNSETNDTLMETHDKELFESAEKELPYSRQ